MSGERPDRWAQPIGSADHRCRGRYDAGVAVDGVITHRVGSSPAVVATGLPCLAELVHVFEAAEHGVGVADEVDQAGHLIEADLGQSFEHTHAVLDVAEQTAGIEVRSRNDITYSFDRRMV